METRLSTRLKSLRKNLSFSTSDVVKKLLKQNLRYSDQSIYKWEQGTAVPEIKVIAALAKIYHCSLSYLIEEKEVEYKNLTASEIFLLRLYRNDFLFRSIVRQIKRRNDRDTIII